MGPKRNKENRNGHRPMDKNIISPTIESLLVNENSRQSIGKKRSLLLPTEQEDFFEDAVENDDEREIRARRDAAEEHDRRRKEEEKDKQAKSTPFGINSNASKAEWEEHFSSCMKLCNSNRVNCKNAFKLQMIDYMKLIFLEKSKKIENLSLMSCTLDASAKIYSFRVDKVYADMVKVISGKEWSKEDETEPETNGSDSDNIQEDLDEEESGKKKKKFRNNDVSHLQLDKMLCKDDHQIDKNENADGERVFKDRTTLPQEYDYFLECPISDPEGELILNGPVISTSMDPGSNKTVRLGPRYKGAVISIDPNFYLPSYLDIKDSFCLIGTDEQADISAFDQDLIFDADQPVGEDLRADQDMDDMMGMGNDGEVGGGDYDDGLSEDEVPLDPLIPSQLGPNVPAVPKAPSFSVKAMTRLVSADHDEFSFFDSTKLPFWKGPSHWSLKQSKKQGVRTQKENKKPFQALDFSLRDKQKILTEYSENVNVLLNKKTLKLWNKDKYFEPEDIRYSQRQMLSLFSNDRLLYIDKNFSTLGVYFSSLNDQDGEEPVISFSENMGEEMDDGADDGDHFDLILDDPAPPSSPSELAQPLEERSVPESAPNDLIPAPPMVEQIQINFARTQKKIDMKLIKATLWKLLNLNATEEVRFSDAYEKMYQELPTEDAKALSFPIAFMALLHLANEKCLQLHADGEMKNITVCRASPPRPNLDEEEEE